MKWVKRLGMALGAVVVLIAVWAAVGAMVYSPEYVSRVLTSRESSVDDYLYKFPLSHLSASATPYLLRRVVQRRRRAGRVRGSPGSI